MGQMVLSPVDDKDGRVFSRTVFLHLEVEAGRSRMHEPSLSHKRPRFGCFAGTFSPSSLQILSTRLWLTRHPSSRSSAVILR